MPAARPKLCVVYVGLRFFNIEKHHCIRIDLEVFCFVKIHTVGICCGTNTTLSKMTPILLLMFWAEFENTNSMTSCKATLQGIRKIAIFMHTIVSWCQLQPPPSKIMLICWSHLYKASRAAVRAHESPQAALWEPLGHVKCFRLYQKIDFFPWASFLCVFDLIYLSLNLQAKGPSGNACRR